MKKIVLTLMAALIAVFSFGIPALAANYAFEAKNNDDFYTPTPYEEAYGSQYNYGGLNVIDVTDHTHLLPGIVPTTGRQAASLIEALPSYDGAEYYPAIAESSFVVDTDYTPLNELIRQDGSIGTVTIPSLSISMKVYEGTSSESMNKGLGHFPDSSVWNGNISLCGHNRGSKYAIGSIKNMEIGDTIEYSTLLGTRKYEVTFVGTISSSDWTYISATSDNRITLVTCLADQPSLRVCIQAKEIR